MNPEIKQKNLKQNTLKISHCLISQLKVQAKQTRLILPCALLM